MSDDRYDAHPDDYDPGYTDGQAYDPALDASRSAGGYNPPPSYTVPGSPGYNNQTPASYYPAGPSREAGRPSGTISGLAIAGLIVSVVAIFTNLFLLGLPAVVGIVLSVIALVRDVKRRGRGGRWLAWAGIIIGALSALLSVLVLVLGAISAAHNCTTGANGVVHCGSNYNYNSGNL